MSATTTCAVFGCANKPDRGNVCELCRFRAMIAAMTAEIIQARRAVAGRKA